MRQCYRLFQRKNGIWFLENRQTRQQESLRTRDKDAATRLFHGRNEAAATPGALALHMARGYLAAADPAIAKRNWQYVVEELIKTKHGANAERWRRAIKDKAFTSLWSLPLIETRPENFLKVL